MNTSNENFHELEIEPGTGINYPIGMFMDHNMPYILAMAQAVIDQFGKENITLVCRGSSGAIIAGIIAMFLTGPKIAHIKKSGENSHSPCIPTSKSRKSIFVDDFLDTGKTLFECWKNYMSKLHRDSNLIRKNNYPKQSCKTFDGIVTCHQKINYDNTYYIHDKYIPIIKNCNFVTYIETI